jgi:predicted DNA-binding transcriptional regulator YafY
MLIGVFENCYVLVAWCETRSAYRNFRLDSINELTILEEKYSKSRNSLLKEWQSMEGITDKVIRY